MHHQPEIRDSLTRVAREHEAENLRHDVHQLGAHLAAATSLDAALVERMLDVAGRLMAHEAVALDHERRDARDSGDPIGAHAFEIGRNHAYLLGTVTIPGLQEQVSRLAGIFRNPDEYVAWERQPAEVTQ